MRDSERGQMSKTEMMIHPAVASSVYSLRGLSLGARQVLTRWLTERGRDEAESLMLVKWAPTVCPVKLFTYWPFLQTVQYSMREFLMLSS